MFNIFLSFFLLLILSTTPVKAQDLNDMINSSLQGALGQFAQPSDGFNLTNTEIHNQSFASRDLTGASFLNVQFYNCNFDGANLSGARLTNITFNNCSISGANLSSTTFMNVEFVNGDLRKSIFDGAQLTNVSFEQGAKLYGVDLTKARLLNVDYDGADFNTANVIQSKTITKTLTQKPTNTKYHTQANIDLAILFEFDSDKLKPEAWDQLQELSKALNSQQLQNASFVLEGHTDAMGSDDYNTDLSYRRAFSVRKALTGQLDVDGNRLTVKGYGEKRPVADNDSEYGRSQNRRVTVVNIGTP